MSMHTTARVEDFGVSKAFVAQEEVSMHVFTVQSLFANKHLRRFWCCVRGIEHEEAEVVRQSARADLRPLYAVDAVLCLLGVFARRLRSADISVLQAV